MGSTASKKSPGKEPLMTMSSEDKTGDLVIPVKKPQLVPLNSALTKSSEDKTGDLPIPAKKPQLVPLRNISEEEKTGDLPTPTKIKKMLSEETTKVAETKVISNPEFEAVIQKEIGELNNKNSKLQEELQKVSRFLVQENKKMMPLLEKNTEETRKSAEVLGNGFQGLEELKSTIEKLHFDFKCDYESLETRRAELKSEIAGLENSTEEYRNARKQYETLQSELSILVNQKQEIEQELSKLVISGKEEVVDLKSQKTKCETELAWIKFELNEYYSKEDYRIAEETEYKEKREILLKEVEDLECRHKDILALYNEKSSIISTYQEQCDKLVKQIEELKAKEVEEKEEFNRFQIQRKNCEQALAFINVELHEFSIKKESMQFEEADLDQKRTSLNKEIANLEKKYSELSSIVRSKNDSLIIIHEECEKYNSKVENLKKLEIIEKNEISKLITEKSHCEHQASLVKLDLHELTLKKEQKLNEEIELDKKRGILEQKISSLEIRYDDVCKRYREKNDALAITHEEYNGLSDRVQNLRINEVNLNSEIEELKNELCKLKEAASFSNEKQAHYQNAMKESEENYKNKLAYLENEFQYKQATMELELKKMEEKGLQEVKNRIADTEEAIHRFLNKNQDMLADAIGDTVYVKGQYSLVKPESAPHFDEVKNEIRKVIGSYFHQSVHPNYKEKIMQKIYIYWALSASVIAAGSIILWFLKK